MQWKSTQTASTQVGKAINKTEAHKQNKELTNSMQK